MLRRKMKSIRANSLWSHPLVLRAVLTVGSLVGLVLASGAGSQWGN